MTSPDPAKASACCKLRSLSPGLSPQAMPPPEPAQYVWPAAAAGRASKTAASAKAMAASVAARNGKRPRWNDVVTRMTIFSSAMASAYGGGTRAPKAWIMAGWQLTRSRQRCDGTDTLSRDDQPDDASRLLGLPMQQAALPRIGIEI